ncbi:hypothetical protein [Methylobacterium sp. CM6246]
MAASQDMLVETAIGAGNMYALFDAMRTERDAWRDEAERSRYRPVPTMTESPAGTWSHFPQLKRWATTRTSSAPLA